MVKLDRFYCIYCIVAVQSIHILGVEVYSLFFQIFSLDRSAAAILDSSIVHAKFSYICVVNII